MLHMQQILPKGKCSHFYRNHVEMPHDFAGRIIQEVSYYTKYGATWVSCPPADVVTRATPL